MGEASRRRQSGYRKETFKTNVLYKFLKYEHAYSLTSSGVMRIGTLSDYEREDKHGAEIGDATENRTEITEPIDWVSGTGQPTPLFLQRAFDISPESMATPGLVFDRCAITVTESSPDRWIYSTTRIRSLENCKRAGYDTVVRIGDAAGFCALVGEHLDGKFGITHANILDCIYGDKNILLSDHRGILPELRKLPKYEYQGEARMIFVPIALPIEPQIIAVPAVSEFCEIVARLN